VSSRTVFVGRTRELAELCGALDEGGERQSQLFLISGEPGIGKTRLVDELSARARARGLRVLWGRCWEGEGAPAFWPWIQVIRTALTSVRPEQRDAVLESATAPAMAHDIAQIVPELRPALATSRTAAGSPPDPEQARFRLFDSVTHLLENLARSGAILIVLDDLHDADEASLMLLRFVVSQLRNASIVLVAIYREAEVRRSRALGKLIGELSREARLLPLAGLSETEVAALVEDSIGQAPGDQLVSRLHAATGGNPLFVDGIVRMLAADGNPGYEMASDRPFRIPQGVREAIRNRLAALSPQVNSLLAVAAAIGNEFEVVLCRLVARVSAGQVHRRLEEAASAGIVTPLGYGRFRFSHALIRGVLYDDIDTNRRLRLHRRIGEAMEEIHHEDLKPRLAELAYHFREAGILDKAIDYLIRAGQAAECVFAHEEAARLYASAIDLIRLHAPADRARELEVLMAVASTSSYAGMFPASQEAFSQAVEISRGLQDWKSLARAVIGLVGQPQDALVRRTDPRVVALVEESLAMHREEDALRSMLLSRLAVEVHLHAEDPERAESLFRQAIALARRTGDRNAYFNALNSRAYFRILGPDDEDLIELVAISNNATDPDAFWLGFAWEFRRHLMNGDAEELDAAIQRYGRVAEKSRLPGARSVLAAARSIRVLMDGNLEDGERYWEDARRILEPWERFDFSQLYPGMLPFRREQDRLSDIADLARRGVDMFPSWSFIRASLAQVLLDSGNEAESRIEFERLAINGFRDVPHDTNWLPTMTLLADVCASMRDAQRARVLYELLLPHARQNSHFLIMTCYGPVSHYLGLLATTMTRYEEAEIHFQQALQFSLKMKARLLAAYTKRDYASMLLARAAPGDRASALVLVSETSRTAADLGLRRLTRQLKALRDSGAANSDRHPPPLPSDDNLSEAGVHKPSLEHWADHIFRNEGEFWTIAYRGTVIRLKDAKGLRYLAYLLAHPDERIHVFDLVTIVEGGAAAGGSAAGPRPRGQADNIETVRGLGDAGPALDARARAEYKRRLGELRAELEDAESFNDFGHAERIRGEIEFLSAELSAGVGIGGRARKTAAHAERTRQTVSKSIRAIVGKIRHKDPSLGHHLGACIKTGYFCAYLPEPDRKIDWRF
jgi:tetratricopeptide (TPR) repeat protein